MTQLTREPCAEGGSMSDREEFERSYGNKYPHCADTFQRDAKRPNEYWSDIVQHRWEGFQLGRSSVAEKVPVTNLRIAVSIFSSMHWDDDAEKIASFLTHITSIKEGNERD